MNGNHKYYYNQKTLQYEKLKYSKTRKIYNFLGLMAICLFIAGIFMAIFWNYFETPKTKIYKAKLEILDSKYEHLNEIVEQFNQQIMYLEKKDNEVYRTIFQAANIDDSLRSLNANDKINMFSLTRNNSATDLYDAVEMNVYKLKNRINFQKKSFDEIDELIKRKEELFKALPAIQPISNHDLNRIASGFGYRIDPVYKTEKFHEGVDFSAPTGTPIYATADGAVIKKEFNGGYGNHIVINHGFGYETLYAHMSEFKCKIGQKVKRGEVIGYVGNTGKSVGPHCHYEVKKNGIKINPIYYFFSDLSGEQYEKIIIQANQKNQSID